MFQNQTELFGVGVCVSMTLVKTLDHIFVRGTNVNSKAQQNKWCNINTYISKKNKHEITFFKRSKNLNVYIKM